MSTRTVEVKFVGGPMNGRLLTVPTGTERVAIGRGVPFWYYTYAGKENQRLLFAKEPKSRKLRKFIFWHVGKFGRDPRVSP